MSNALHKNILSRASGDSTNDLAIRAYWSKHTFITECFEKDLAGARAMRDWCAAKWGEEANPFLNRPGVWLRGFIAIDGWAWYGFATEEALEEFKAEWVNE